MTILDISSSSEDKRSRQFFIRIENFPSSASHREVKAFFGGLTISPGGIFIKGSNVFVSFEQWRDMSAAMERDRKSIHDHKLLLSIVELKEVQEFCAKICQRHLHFESGVDVQKNEEKTTTPTVTSPEGLLRKIRPTAVQCDNQIFRRDVTFAPKEVDNQACGYADDLDCTTCKRLTSGGMPRKKIKPTPVRSIADHTTAFMQTMTNSTVLSND